ncbi:MAG: hypothetical protein WC889_09440 [Myxococcota bacterium]
MIGGTACEAWMSRSGLLFRKTKDLDIVLVIEALNAVFVERFREFVKAGKYGVRERQDTGKKEFYRFMKPVEPGYPSMMELFSGATSAMDLGPGQEIVPIKVEESVASMSAILMNEDYYNFILASRYDVDGISMVSVNALIPLKARAWLDLINRRSEGKHVDEGDINKHRNDLFRLALTLPASLGPGVPEVIQADVREFLGRFPDSSEEWPSINQALKETRRGGRLPTAVELRDAVATFFGIA